MISPESWQPLTVQTFPIKWDSPGSFAGFRKEVLPPFYGCRKAGFDYFIGDPVR